VTADEVPMDLAAAVRLDDVRLALSGVYSGADWTDAQALIDQLEDRGLRVVRQ